MPIPDYDELHTAKAILDEACGRPSQPVMVCVGGPLNGVKVAGLHSFKVKVGHTYLHYRACEKVLWHKNGGMSSARFWLYTNEAYDPKPNLDVPIPDELYQRRSAATDLMTMRDIIKDPRTSLHEEWGFEAATNG